jgi:hypothetical protein
LLHHARILIAVEILPHRKGALKMSAFIVGHDHIDALLTYAVDRRTSYWTGKARIDITRATAEEIGRILLMENELSVRHRYPDDAPGDLPGTIGENAETYKFRPFMARLTPVVILKACNCFDYQACEHDGYRASMAWKIVDAIRHQAINDLPGYDGADGWDITRKVGAV